MNWKQIAAFWGVLAAVTVTSFETANAYDWPMYQHDSARSGMTAETLEGPLSVAWTWASRAKPVAAWDEPGRWDGWHKVWGLKNRQVYDKAFHVAAVGDRVYFGTSTDDKLYCLDAATGEQQWVFYAEGPIRLAPLVEEGRVYFGSDDGHVYALDADNGELVWKARPGPADMRVPGNGRMTSLWAVRTGVVKVDDTLYCGAGVFPSETVYVTALDAETGEERWKTPMTELPAMGYILASQTRVYVTTGRSRPVIFDRNDGKLLYQAEGNASGTYALLTGETLVYGPGKTGEISLQSETSADQLAAFRGNHMIVTGPRSYLHTDDDLSALDRERYVELYSQRTAAAQKKRALGKQLDKLKADDGQRLELEVEIGQLSKSIDELTIEMKSCLLWKEDCEMPFSLILGGSHLYAGGQNEVGRFSTETGAELDRLEVNGAAYGLAVAGGRLFVSTDKGTIHCFSSEKRTAVNR